MGSSLKSSFAVFFYLALFCGAAISASVSAKGGAELVFVPLGRDSLFETNIVGINTSAESTSFKITVAPNDEQFYEPLRELEWLVPVPETVIAPPNGQTRPISLLARFPDDINMRNRRFSASVIMQQISDGMISLAVALKVRIETEPSREMPEVVFPKKLSLFPSNLEMEGESDSIWLFNASEVTDTVEVYWTKALSRKDSAGEVKIFKKILLWELPSDSIILKQNQGEWIFFKKNRKDFILRGYIVCIGKRNSLYCKIGDKK